MKKIFLFLILIFSINAFAFYEPNDKSFKDGFEAGLQAIALQGKIDGFQPKKIVIEKEFLLTFDIKKIPLSEALFLQLLANREGFETHLSEDFISFGSFDREIDAKDKMSYLSNKFQINLKKFKIYKNKKEIITYPFLFQKFYLDLLNQAKKDGLMVEVKIIKQNSTIKTKKEKSQTKKIKKEKIIVFKNLKAMSYSNIGDDEKNSKKFVENGLLESKDFQYEKTIITNTNEKFVKVLNKNLYFSLSDVNIKEVSK